jgi:hypothetical protein
MRISFINGGIDPRFVEGEIKRLAKRGGFNITAPDEVVLRPVDEDVPASRAGDARVYDNFHG